MVEGIGKIALDFCGRGGKRLRPRLCRAVFEAARPAVVPCHFETNSAGRIDDVCEAVECFHKASLIHDDIQDCDEERYGRPTVWKEHGVALAIAAGDWLVAHGYGLIVNSGFPNALEMMKATVRSHIALCEGQGDDLMGGAGLPAALRMRSGVERYISVCERKTGEGFALAFRVTGDERYRTLWRDVVSFCIRSQVRSADPKTDGSWCRAFDLELGEAYGCPHDVGWAAYCSESGWTDAEILMGMMMPEFMNGSGSAI